MAVSTQIRADISGIIANVRKRSQKIIEEHADTIFQNLHNLVDKGRQYLIVNFLSVPKPKYTGKADYKRNISPYPRRDTGSLIRALSFGIKKNPIQYGYRRINQVQFTIYPIWGRNPQPNTNKGNYPELLNSGNKSDGRPYYQHNFKTKLKNHMADYLQGKIA